MTPQVGLPENLPCIVYCTIQVSKRFLFLSTNPMIGWDADLEAVRRLVGHIRRTGVTPNVFLFSNDLKGGEDILVTNVKRNI